MEKWLMDCTFNKTYNTKLSLVYGQIQDVVFSTREDMIGDWVQIPKWDCHLAVMRELTMSIYVLFAKREKGAEIQKNKNGRKEPCKSIDDTRTCERNFIGASGHDHKNTLLQNIAAPVACFELLQLHALVNNHNASDGSWINSANHCMNILNLGLAHWSYARDECNTRSYLAKIYSSMKAQRDLGDRDEMVK
jgi:hypothetical protein